MTSTIYDLITVGGGLGGASLAKAMAEHGAKVLVLERETQFKDRVRGEWMAPWGVAEAKALGIYELLRDACGHEPRWWDTYLGPMRIEHRDFSLTTPQQTSSLTFYHPDMQEILLQAAADAGAEVRRGASVRHVSPGSLPAASVEQKGRVDEVRARMIVGTDGRASLVRQWAGFAVRGDPERRLISGVLYEEMPTPPDTNHIVINPALGQAALLFPLGQGRVRAYLGYHKNVTAHRFQGTSDLPRFVEACVKAGAQEEFYTRGRAAGPLATFDGADTWVEHPYREGVALIGDAAATSDPTFGQGLSLTLRDARVLRNSLLAHKDWNVAGQAYAVEHDRYYRALRHIETWWGEVLLEPGEAGDARRAQALPLIAQDNSRVPDHFYSGLDLPVDETVRRRFFGEE